MSIETEIIQRYQNNLKFLQKYDNNLFHKISAIDYHLSQNTIPTFYHLEYIEEENSFDIYDEKNRKFIYNKKPTRFNQDLVNSSTLLENSFNLTSYNNIFSKKKYEIDDTLDTATKEAYMLLNDLADYALVFDIDINKTPIPKEINKYIVIGTLLGTHIPLIHNKIKAKTYFICENNIEIFRLSLFITDYAALSRSSKLVFSVMDTRSEFINKFSHWYRHDDFNSNLLLYYSSIPSDNNDYFARIQSSIISSLPYTFSYTRVLNSLLTSNIYNLSHYPTLNTKKTHTILKNTPILILAAGPSLKKNIEWVYKYQSDFFIVAIGAVVTLLLEYDIKPDLITSSDPSTLINNQFPDNIIEQLNSIPILLGSMSHLSVVQKFKKDNLFFFESITSIKNTTKATQGASIGETTLQLVNTLGADNIYLLGTDLALDNESGQTHFNNNHSFSTQFNIQDLNLSQKNFLTADNNDQLINTPMKVKGNLRENVITTALFEASITKYNILIKQLLSINSDLQIFNLSDGALLENTTPLDINNVPNLTNNLESNSFKVYLEAHSSLFNKEEKEILIISLRFIDFLLHELEQLQNIKTKTYQQFILQRTQLFNLILFKSGEFRRIFLHHLFINYILTTEPMFYYFFNTQKVINESNIIKKIKKIWINHLTKISIEYKNILDSME